MGTETELVYSDDLCSAFLASIVMHFEQRHPQSWLGRTAIQKLTYFAKVLGVPIPCNFGIYTYGPYSDAVTFSVESLLADEVLIDRSNRPNYSNYGLGQNALVLLNRYSDELAPYDKRIDNVVLVIGAFSHSDLELISTLHFVAGRLKQLMQKAPGKSDVVREFTRIKGERFSNAQVNGWYDALNKAGLV
jgi:uncharacterized protein YwgA